MKLLQFVSDWGFRQEGKDVSHRNEVELGQGRSLQRPQNKQALSTPDLLNLAQDDATLSSLTLQELLEHPSVRLDPSLRRVALYSLALEVEDQEVTPVSAQMGLMRLYRHLNGLGRYGDTAFLSPLYGAGEVAQAFCRTAAVWGGTYVLNHSPQHLVVDSATHRVLGIVDGGGQPIACPLVV